MESNGISLSDIAALVKDHDGWDGGAWWIIVLVLFMCGGGLGWGGNGSAAAATTADIQRAVDLNSIQEGQRSIAADVQRTAYENMATTKDAAYNNLSETRDVESAMSAGFANVQNALTAGFANQASCCCETQRAIDGVNYNAAMNTASINANTTAQTQNVLDAIAGNRMADMQNQINALQLQNAVAGVVRYPMASTYSSGSNPFCGYGCGC